MKKFILSFLVIWCVTSCATYDYVVDSDYNYNGKFHRYKTFDFASNQSFAGVLEDKEIVESSLKGILQAWGYRHKDRRPDLVVVYSIFFDELNFRGYSQPEFGAWLRHNFSKEKLAMSDDSLSSTYDERETYAPHLKEDYDKIKYSLREGTILISFLDRKRNQTVWQGYASGVFGSDAQRKERVMKSAVIQILDEYKILAFSESS